MKKVLALFLAIVMLFGALSVGASAMDLESVRKEQNLSNNQAILSFDLNGGSIKNGVRVYTPKYLDVATGEWVEGSFSWVEDYNENFYYMIPENGAQTPGSTVRLPSVTPPSGYVFNGWYCVWSNSTHPGNRMYKIPDYTGGQVIQFVADYALEETEPEAMDTVMDILVKVLGTIIGLLFLSDREEGAVEAGMQLMQDLLGTLLS